MGSGRRRHRELARYLLDTARPISRKEAEAQYSRHAVKACIRDGSLRHVLPQIVAHRLVADDREVRLRAAALWIEPAGGAITGVAALWMWGVVTDPPAVTTVMVLNPLHRQCPRWLRQYRPRKVPERVRVRGMPAAPLAYAVVHAWNETRGDAAVGLVVRAIGRKHVSSAEVAMAAHETGRVRRRRDLMALLDVLVGGVTSFLEHRAKTLVFPPAEFPELRWQVPISACGKARTLDIFDAATRTAIELDSHEFHDKVQDRLADMERDAELASIGIQTLHVDFQDVFSRPDWCRTMYRRIRAERLKASTASGTRPQ